MILKFASTVLVAGIVASAVSIAHAAPPPEATMLVPGVYTTPEISAACQAYAAQRVPVGGDQQRQSVALACAKKMWAQKYGKKSKKAKH